MLQSPGIVYNVAELVLYLSKFNSTIENRDRFFFLRKYRYIDMG